MLRGLSLTIVHLPILGPKGRVIYPSGDSSTLIIYTYTDSSTLTLTVVLPP